jgi:hypothetical protein
MMPCRPCQLPESVGQYLPESPIRYESSEVNLLLRSIAALLFPDLS